jgi:HEAT repeat protein
VQAVADTGTAETFDRLIASDDEYLVACGVVGLGARWAHGDETVEGRLRRHATDSRWRVREAVAMALQRLGDADVERLLAVVADWVEDPDPLVERAAVAAVCEPRLIVRPDASAQAIRTCRRATDLLLALPPPDRRRPEVRTLRQALGYAWSVAVAADPAPGLAAFRALAETSDPDAAWIVRENLRKKRLRRLL